MRSQYVTSNEKGNRSQSVTGSQKHRDPRYIPYAFTEHGALMAANVLRSPRAVEMSVYVVRAFVRLRQWLADHAELNRRLDAMEREYDTQFKVVFDAIRQLMTPPEPKKRKIGFLAKDPCLRPVLLLRYQHISRIHPVKFPNNSLWFTSTGFFTVGFAP